MQRIQLNKYQQNHFFKTILGLSEKPIEARLAACPEPRIEGRDSAGFPFELFCCGLGAAGILLPSACCSSFLRLPNEGSLM
jgi:hypothetical protein